MNESGFFWNDLATCSSDQPSVRVESATQDWGVFRLDAAEVGTPLTLNGKSFHSGFGTHADSRIVLCSDVPMARFHAVVGIDCNPDTVSSPAELEFRVVSGGRTLGKTGYLGIGKTETMDLVLPPDTRTLELEVQAKDKLLYLAHADWCDVTLSDATGRTFRLKDKPFEVDTLPVSFVYGDQPSAKLLREWGIVRREEKTSDGRRKQVYTSRNPEDGFECRYEVEEYPGCDAAVGRLSFHNAGTAQSKQLREVRSFDLLVPNGQVRYAEGGIRKQKQLPRSPYRDCFRLHEWPESSTADPLSLSPGGTGRSSEAFLPYFNWNSGARGLMLGVGWTGEWRANFRSESGSQRLSCGMETLDLYLEPGETISQPSTLMLEYSGGDFEHGQNALRRFLRDAWMPKNQRQMPLCLGTWGGDSEDRHRERLAEAMQAGLDFDVYWVDAGWYGSHGGVNIEKDYTFINNFGEWQYNPAIFPDGLGSFADKVHAAGMKFLLWFEVENADRQSPVAQAHPAWFLPLSPDNGTLQLNLARPDAEKWMQETLSTAIRSYGVDFLRQDFNVSPLAAWRTCDRAGRTGETEVRYVEALYRIYDRLHERFPQLMFDNCASGGNRLDFEMMKRSVPLWTSDMQCDSFFDCEDAQNLAAGLHCWLPCFGLGSGGRPLDTYNFRSVVAAGRSIPLEKSSLTPEAAGWLRERFAEYRRLAPLLSADYYLLSKRLPEADQWLVMQFDDPESGRGAVLAFRRATCDYTGMKVCLKGVDPEAEYEWSDADTGATGRASGRELRENGMDLTGLDRRESLLRFYRRVFPTCQTDVSAR